MPCRNCQQSQPPLTETFDESFHRLDKFVAPRPILLCASCIIGTIVPAYRPTLQRWNLGLVVAYAQETNEFCMLFDHTIQEWLALDKAPFEAYTAYYRHCRQQQEQKLQRNEEEEPPQKKAVSFDEFWPSDDLSWTSDEHPPGMNFHCQLRSDGPASVPIAIDITRDLSPSLEAPVLTEVHNTHHHLLPAMSPIPIAAFATATTKTDLKKTMAPVCAPTNLSKAPPRHWSESEDKLLRRAVFQSPLPLKWAQVATFVPNRTSKQCRERYVNHLHNKVKATEWTPVEDALICRLYKVIGSKWVEISRMVPGRSDNSCKNRWHFLRRHFEKYVSGFPSPQIQGSISPMKSRLLHVARARENTLDDMDKAVVKALLYMVDMQPATPMPLPEYSSSFGPFIHPQGVELCVRCGLVASSAQTGPLCRSTRWCYLCSMTPAVLHDDFLRMEHHIRASSRTRVSQLEELNSNKRANSK